VDRRIPFLPGTLYVPPLLIFLSQRAMLPVVIVLVLLTALVAMESSSSNGDES
jgi:hypothetical protein